MFDKKFILIIIVILVLVIIGFGKAFFLGSSDLVASQNKAISSLVASSSQTTASSTPAVNSTTAQSTSSVATSTYAVMQAKNQLFASMNNASRAYEVWPTIISARAQQALDGFTLNAQDLGNNIYKIDIVPKVANYQTQSFVVTGDSKIYFVETSFGDDAPNQDYVYGDDYGVAVNAAGYILQ